MKLWPWCRPRVAAGTVQGGTPAALTLATPISHRAFLKIVVAAVGGAGLPQLSRVARVAEATYIPGGSLDTVDRNLTVQGDLTVRRPDGSGNLGVGVAVPQSRLDVAGSIHINGVEAVTGEGVVRHGGYAGPTGAPATKLEAGDLAATPIPQGALGWWFGTHGSIPPGWEVADGTASSTDPTYLKPDLCDGRFPKAVDGSGDAPGTTGGSASHTHDLPSHTHATSVAGSVKSQQWEPGTYPGSCDHTHSHTVENSSASLEAASNDPPYVEGIPLVYCKRAGGSGGGLQDFAADALPPWKIVIAWHAPGAPPSGWTRCDGSTVNSVATPNLLGRFLKSIPSLATDPGSNGSPTSLRDHATDHCHHTGVADITAAAWPESLDHPWAGHMHTLERTSGLRSTTADVQPPFHRVQYLMFTGHGVGAAAHPNATLQAGDLASDLLVPGGLVLVWCGTLASLPAGYSACDGLHFAGGNPSGYTVLKPPLLGCFVKHVANSGSDGGARGGSAEHTHAGGSHLHTLGAAPWNSFGCAVGGYAQVALRDHGHTVGGTAAPVESGSSLPAFHEVAFIVKQ